MLVVDEIVQHIKGTVSWECVSLFSWSYPNFNAFSFNFAELFPITPQSHGQRGVRLCRVNDTAESNMFPVFVFSTNFFTSLKRQFHEIFCSFFMISIQVDPRFMGCKIIYEQVFWRCGVIDTSEWQSFEYIPWQILSFKTSIVTLWCHWYIWVAISAMSLTPQSFIWHHWVRAVFLSRLMVYIL